jgi:catechol-2,3-dioxygenase
MSDSKRTVQALAEVSIRVRDLDVMQKFYEEVVGLEVLSREESYVFFRIADGYGGHSQNLALFRMDDLSFLRKKAPRLSPEKSSLHHIALSIPLDQYESEKRRLEGLGLSVEATDHAWLHVRSLYFPDPEGNLLEFVCYDGSVR